MVSSQVEGHKAIALQKRPVLGGPSGGQSSLQALDDQPFAGSDTYFGIVINLWKEHVVSRILYNQFNP